MKVSWYNLVVNKDIATINMSSRRSVFDYRIFS